MTKKLFSRERKIIKPKTIKRPKVALRIMSERNWRSKRSKAGMINCRAREWSSWKMARSSSAHGWMEMCKGRQKSSIPMETFIAETWRITSNMGKEHISSRASNDMREILTTVILLAMECYTINLGRFSTVAYGVMAIWCRILFDMLNIIPL